jgi:DNA replication protein DnaC
MTLVTKSIPLDELAYEVVRKRLRETLGDRPESIPCNRNPEHKPRQVDAYMLNKGEVAYIACAECRSEDKWQHTGIPPRILEATVAEYVTTTPEQQEVTAKVTAWVRAHKAEAKDRNTFMLLCGRCGTGKSHLAAACLKAFGGGWFTSPAEIFRMKGARMDDKREPDPIPRAKNTTCLVLDEWVVGGDRSDAPEVWQEILDYRYQRMMPTIICSNEDAQTVVEFIGLPGIEDRIRTDSIVCTFDWESYRNS